MILSLLPFSLFALGRYRNLEILFVMMMIMMMRIFFSFFFHLGRDHGFRLWKDCFFYWTDGNVSSHAPSQTDRHSKNR